MASASAVECTATEGMPSSLQARSTRKCDLAAIGDEDFFEHYSMIIIGSPNSTGWPSSTRICVTMPRARRRNLIHRLHRFDDQQRLAGLHRLADIDERPRAGRGREIGGADHRRRHRARMLGRDRRRRAGSHRCRRRERQRRALRPASHARPVRCGCARRRARSRSRSGRSRRAAWRGREWCPRHRRQRFCPSLVSEPLLSFSDATVSLSLVGATRRARRSRRHSRRRRSPQITAFATCEM